MPNSPTFLHHSTEGKAEDVKDHIAEYSNFLSLCFYKVYTVDRFSLKTVIIGWAALGLFVKLGTETQASIDTSPQQVLTFHTDTASSPTLV